MELKCCTVIDMLWKRKLGSQLSPEIDAILRPSLFIIVIIIIEGTQLYRCASCHVAFLATLYSVE